MARTPKVQPKKFTVKQTITNGEREVDMQLTFTFGYDPDQYGNGFTMCVEPLGGSPEYYDLRYDTVFSDEKQALFVAEFCFNNWDGRNGAYRIIKWELKEEKEQ